ncbi:hypothetical protein BOSP111201_15950 [Bordetella sputigena]
MGCFVGRRWWFSRLLRVWCCCRSGAVVGHGASAVRRGSPPVGSSPIGRSGARAPDSRFVFLVRRPNVTWVLASFSPGRPPYGSPRAASTGWPRQGDCPDGLGCASITGAAAGCVLGPSWLRGVSQERSAAAWRCKAAQRGPASPTRLGVRRLLCGAGPWCVSGNRCMQWVRMCACGLPGPPAVPGRPTGCALPRPPLRGDRQAVEAHQRAAAESMQTTAIVPSPDQRRKAPDAHQRA